MPRHLVLRLAQWGDAKQPVLIADCERLIVGDVAPAQVLAAPPASSRSSR